MFETFAAGAPVAIAMSVILIACAQPNVPADTADAGADGAAGADGPEPSTRRSFDPRGYSNTCTTKSDCTLAPIINDCSTCCGQVPVNAAAVQSDLDDVTRACAGGGRSCLMDCASAHAECVAEKCIACGERTCNDGLVVHTSIKTAGKHVFEATIDGVTTACTLDLPNGMQGLRSIACAQGAEIIDEPTSPTIWSFGIFFRTTTTTAVAFRALRDGTLVGEKTFEPVYAPEPGPNGPQCEPKECVVASATFP